MVPNQRQYPLATVKREDRWIVGLIIKFDNYDYKDEYLKPTIDKDYHMFHIYCHGSITRQEVVLEAHGYSLTAPPELSNRGHISGNHYMLNGLEAYQLELLSSSPFHLVFYVTIMMKKMSDRETLQHRSWDRGRN